MAINPYHNKPEWTQNCDDDGNIKLGPEFDEKTLYVAIPIDLVEIYARKRVIPYDQNSPLLYCNWGGVKVYLDEALLLHPRDPETGESLGRVFAPIVDSEDYYLCIYKNNDAKPSQVVLFDLSKLDDSIKEEGMNWLYMQYMGIIPKNANVDEDGDIVTEKLLTFPKEDLEKVANGPLCPITLDTFQYPAYGDKVLLDQLVCIRNVAFAPLEKNPEWFVIVTTLSEYEGVIGSTIDLIGKVDQFHKMPCVGVNPILGLVPKGQLDRMLPIFQMLVDGINKTIPGCVLMWAKREPFKDTTEYLVFARSVPKDVEVEQTDSGIPKLKFPKGIPLNLYPTENPHVQSITYDGNMDIVPLSEVLTANGSSMTEFKQMVKDTDKADADKATAQAKAVAEDDAKANAKAIAITKTVIEANEAVVAEPDDVD
mgnify:CR=1 FL=1|jgi:hypothetical protein